VEGMTFAVYITQDQTSNKKTRNTLKMTRTRKTPSTLHDQRGFTLVEILAVLIILAIFTTTAIAKYSDIEDTAGRTMLATAVVPLNAPVRHAWFQGALGRGIGSYSYYAGTLGNDVVLTKQQPGKEPKGGTIFLKRDGVRYKLEWYPAPENHPGLFQLGNRTD
jgi:prepilin-type N-terminal cleavage/methylation domain-containing protein